MLGRLYVSKHIFHVYFGSLAVMTILGIKGPSCWVAWCSNIYNFLCYILGWADSFSSIYNFLSIFLDGQIH